jgi:hypothetical protein
MDDQEGVRIRIRSTNFLRSTYFALLLMLCAGVAACSKSSADQKLGHQQQSKKSLEDSIIFLYDARIIDDFDTVIYDGQKYVVWSDSY